MTPELSVAVGLALHVLAAIAGAFRESPVGSRVQLRLRVADALAAAGGSWFLVSGLWSWLTG